MKEINLYKADGSTSMKFKFQNIDIRYNSARNWVAIRASGRTLTLYEVPILAFDDSLETAAMTDDWNSLWQEEMNTAYTSGNRILALFLPNGNPIKLFVGTSVALVGAEEGFTHFLVNGKDVWSYNLSYMILSKDAQ